MSALWAFLAIAMPVLASLLGTLSTVDLAYHLRAGGQFLDTGVIPTTDTYTFTVEGQSWLNQQWGAQALLASVHRFAGWTGLVVLRAALVGAIVALVFSAVRRQGVAVRPAALLTIAAFAVASVAMALRPQLFGMALFALVLLLVVERRRHPRLLWAIPPIVLIWANLHGSFFLGPAVLGLAWLADLHDRVPGAHRTLAVAVVAALAAMVNPFGPSIWIYAAGLTTNPAVTERVTEWRPTSIRSASGLAFFASSLVLVAALVRRARPVPWPALLWFAAFFLIGAWAVRGAAWWPIAAAVGFAGLLGSGFLGSGAPGEAPRAVALGGRRPANALIALVLVVAGVALLPVWRPTVPGLDAPAGVLQQAPPGITAALQDAARDGDRIYLPQAWASWIEFAVPQSTVVLDSRFELFSEPLWQAYVNVSRGLPGWPEQLDAWGVTLIVVASEQPGGLLEQLLEHPGWRAIHRDADGIVLARVDR